VRPRRQVVDSILAFWAKVDRAPDDGCWEWTGSRDVTGYGIVRLDGRLHKAHRVAWMLANGQQPGLRLRHVCGNVNCVRPDHLASRSGSSASNQSAQARTAST
jgi:HNH endonuclease